MNSILPHIAYGNKLVELASEMENIVVVCSDLRKSMGLDGFFSKFPDRFIDVGIAEQNMLGIAAGLSTVGLIPFANTFAVFASMRACEQLRTSVAYPCLNVKIVTTNLGLTCTFDGPTHQAIEDLAIMRAIPNLTIISPADSLSTGAAVEQALNIDAPVCLRLCRVENTVYDEKNIGNFIVGKGVILREGEDVAIISASDTLGICCQAANLLADEGIMARIIDMHTVKPIDTDLIINTARKFKMLVAVENHNVLGGLGSAISEVVSERYPCFVYRHGIKDTFAESGDYKDLMHKYELDVEGIYKYIKRIFLKHSEKLLTGKVS